MTRRDEGFTLIEALVAMVILALGAVSLLSATEGHAVRIGQVVDRTVASWVAQERLAQLRLGLAPPQGPVEMMGLSWDVVAERVRTQDLDLDRLTVSVGPLGKSSRLVTLTGYAEAEGEG